MRHTPAYILDDEAEIKRLVRENPWVTFVSDPAGGMVASHYPTLLDEDADGIVLLTHFGRPDEKVHGLDAEGGPREMLAIVQGPHGYVSPSWYAPGDMVPTWNHVTAHLYGVPEILSDADNLVVLERLVDHFEEGMPRRALAADRSREGGPHRQGHHRAAHPGHARRGAQEAQPEPHRRRPRQRHRAPRRRRALLAPRTRRRDEPRSRAATRRRTRSERRRCCATPASPAPNRATCWWSTAASGRWASRSTTCSASTTSRSSISRDASSARASGTPTCTSGSGRCSRRGSTSRRRGRRPRPSRS